MKKHDVILIEKLSMCENPEVDSYTKKEYIPGFGDGIKSVPVDSYFEGVLQQDIGVGKPIYLYRTSRNGIEVLGFTETSIIKKIEKNILHTQNSIYRLTVLKAKTV